MANRLTVWCVRAFVVVGLVAVWAGSAQAAGEWEWTAGQGWVQGAGVSRPTAKEQLHHAYDLEQRGEFMDSARQYFLLIQNFPESQEAGIGLQRLARCLFEMENYYTSYKAIEQVIETYPNTGRMSDLVEIELRIAKKMMVSQTPDILTGRENSRDANVRRALEIVGSVIEHDPYGPVAAEAYLVQGEGHLFLNEINAARRAFETVRDEFPRSDFVERARLGILQCDNLTGQASPREVAEQLEVVRESEANRRTGAEEVDDTLRQLMEVEAGKMLEQAEQYNRMGTRKGVEASQFLYNEIIRRYPGTDQADTSMERLGKLKVPKEPSRVTQTFRNIKLNPFSWNKDPEPPWIVPQLDPEDVVMVDSGMTPIFGVTDSGPPQTAASATVRPAALDNAPPPTDLSMAGTGGGFSPAPPFIDGVGDSRVYTSGQSSQGMAPPPNIYDLPPGRPANPLPTISEDELIPVGGAGTTSLGGYSGGSTVYTSPAPAPVQQQSFQGYGTTSTAPIPELTPGYAQPLLNERDYNTPLSDLVGPSRRYESQPQPGYAAPVQPIPQYYDSYPAQPQPAPVYGGSYGAGGGYTPAPQGGGWTLSDDFR